MPHKHNAGRRHHIPKMTHRVTNWPEYEASLRSRGSLPLTLWITPGAPAQWQAPRRTTPGGQSRHSEVAIETTLMLSCAFQMRLRQTEGLRRRLQSRRWRLRRAISARWHRLRPSGLDSLQHRSKPMRSNSVLS
jgi:hypothetical protein